MDDYSKRKKALINELEHLRTKIAELKSINERQEIEIKKTGRENYKLKMR